MFLFSHLRVTQVALSSPGIMTTVYEEYKERTRGLGEYLLSYFCLKNIVGSLRQ